MRFRTDFALISAMLAACVGPPPSGAGPRSAEAATEPKITAPPGSTLSVACVPTGPELCFNAIDDNCDGVIDEGCGLGTGPLQFTIAWGDSAADVDLQVVDPTGTRVSERTRVSPSGLHLDRDCPSEGCYGQNVENIFLEGGDIPKGHYIVEVRLTGLHGAETPVAVRFGARVGTRTYGADLALSAPDESRTFLFDL